MVLRNLFDVLIKKCIIIKLLLDFSLMANCTFIYDGNFDIPRSE